MTYPEAIQWLYELRLFGAKLGLENPRHLAELAGNPQDRLRIIHVAGTNGKGSVCAMLESIYRHAGYRTGLFTSPHLISFRERMQVNRQLIAEEDIIRLAGEMQTLLRDCPHESHPTFFEVITRGRHPLEDLFNSHPREALVAHREREMVMPSVYLPPDTPPARAQAIDGWFMAATAKDPNHRFQSAKVMQVALSHIV